MANVTFYKRVILLLFLVCSVQLFSQKNEKIKEFSTEFSVFQKQLKAFMLDSDNSELRSSYKTFTNSSSSFTVSDQLKIIQISNQMLDKRFRVKPHFNSFINTIIAINTHEKKDVLLKEWLNVVSKIIDESTIKKFMIFCEFSVNLVNDRVLRSSKVAQWVVDHNNYDFRYNDNEPVVIFSSPTKLSCFSKGIPVNVINTKGSYYPLENEWIGEGGVINWEVQGIDKDSIFTKLSNYNVDTRKSNVIADSVLFYNKGVLLNPVFGKLIHKGAYSKQIQKYPQFTSYSKHILLKEIFPNVDYRGGYKLVGKNFVADGGDYAEARIVFKNQGKDLFVAYARKFSIGTDKISSQEAGVKIFFDNDSIYHSSLKFKYINSERKLELFRDRNSISASTMLNTYHKLTMDFELLEWNIDSDIITFGSLPGASQSEVIFESISMFDSTRFHALSGIDAVHPLMLINKYVSEKKETKFFVEDFARFVKFPLSQVKSYLMRIASNGFVFYDFAEERISVQPMLFNYIDAVSGIGDYDVIRFKSIVKPGDYYIDNEKHLVNAALNISTKDLNIIGVNTVPLSRTRKVFIKPYNGKMIVKQNRDFIFNGQVRAGRGRLNLFGSNFYFHYQDFKLDLNKIDSVQLSVPFNPSQKDMYGNEKLVRVKTVIESVTGDLKIDHPSNKSGVRKDSFPGFPVFRSFEDSYAYYDKKSIYNGIYSRDDFSFHLLPFEIDSLDNYSGKGLAFAGTFESSGIFPEFNDTLRLQNDYSLGLNRKTPDDGFDIYKGKAKYFNDIHLSHQKGLQGKGFFTYLTAEAKSEEILFFPDSTQLYTDSFLINEVTSGIEFPQVYNTNTYIHYEPYNDKMMIRKIKKDFIFYKGDATFSGNLLMQPTGLTGGGVMTLDKANVSSNLFSYNANWFGSDTVNLEVFNDEGNIGIKANNLRAYIDLNTRKGVFHSNGTASYIEFPANNYISYIDKLDWAMDAETFVLGNEASGLSKGSKFVSVHPLQDSLFFTAKSAFYSLKDYIIHTQGVDSILVADAAVFPDSGVVTIAKNGVMQTLLNAKILVDEITQYHTFTNSTVDIQSAHKYVASANYTYKDAMNNEQQIFFEEITVNSDTITEGKGSVGNENPFRIDTQFEFKGTVNLLSDKKNLIFDGFFIPKFRCTLFEKEWIKFRSEINPQEIIFSLEEKLYNDNNDLLSTGLITSFDSTNLYSTFLSKKKRIALDFDVFSASHSLRYDEKESAYIVGGPDSIINSYTLYDKSCSTRGFGNIDLNVELGQINIKTLGSVKHNMALKETDISGFLMLDFFFSNKAMEIMAKDIYSAPGDGVFEYDKSFTNNLYRLLEKDIESILIDLELHDEYSKLPKEMYYSFVFPKNNFIWDNTNKAYVSKGEIWLSNIKDKQTHALLDGYIIIEKSRNNDVLTIYLQTEFYDEYYFQYKNGVMKAWSTTNEFNEEILDVKEGKRRADAKRGKKPYRYTVALEEDKDKFLRLAKKKY